MTSTRRWSIVVLLSLGMVIAYVDRSNLSVALASDEVKAYFGLTDNDRGLMNSAFFWSYAFLQIPAGFFVDRYGVKFPYAIAFLFWSLLSATTSMVTTVTQLVGLRFLLGIGEALVTPASMRWIRFNVPEQERGLAVGIYMAGTKYGPAIGTWAATWLLLNYGWREMFAILGIGCLVWLIPWMLLVKNDDRDLEAAHLKATKAAPVPFKDLFKTPLMWGVLIGTFCYNYFVFFCLTWLPAYFKESRGLSLASSGVYTAFSFGGMATVAIIAGFVADRMVRRGGDAVKVRKGFTLAGFLVASTEVIGPFTSSNEVALAFSIISLSGLGLATANYWALTQTLMPGAAIGRIAGAQNFASNLAGIVAPILTGWLKTVTGSYNPPIYMVAGFLAMGIAAYAFLVRPEYAPRGTA